MASLVSSSWKKIIEVAMCSECCMVECRVCSQCDNYLCSCECKETDDVEMFDESNGPLEYGCVDPSSCVMPGRHFKSECSFSDSFDEPVSEGVVEEGR
jgi:hypothetical protein